MEITQNKSIEVSFFDSQAALGEYNVFTPRSTARIVDKLLQYSGLKGDEHIVDLGCGTGVFTSLLQQRGFQATGVDISPAMIGVAAKNHPACNFLVGDVEKLPFENNSVDAVLLSGLIHHFTDPGRCLAEVYRVLKPGGKVMAFDPNRLNPFMYLYRDRSSPLYSNQGVTENERPVLPWVVRRQLICAGLTARTEFLSHLHYQYVASPLARAFLFFYNWMDTLVFGPPWLKPFRAFVLTLGSKPNK